MSINQNELSRILAPVSLACQKAISKEHAGIYHEVLSGLDQESLAIAVSRFLSEAADTSLPMPGLLLRYADEAANGVELTADQAVDLVWKAIRKHKSYDMDCVRAAYADLGPKISAAMDAAGGYQRFCDCSSGDKGTLIAQFREAWNANVRREEQARRLPAALVPRLNGAEVQLRIETPTTPRLVAQGGNP